MRAVLILAHHTSWSLAEISEMPLDELSEWFLTLPKGS